MGMFGHRQRGGEAHLMNTGESAKQVDIHTDRQVVSLERYKREAARWIDIWMDGIG